ncbi:ubiquinone biosynthesis methyltransferase UbiE [Pararhizobium sp. DWP3-4]|uniref:ubiquinone biosynthesis methyltransferase UbiE n=1 Tax=Pararhizobium sp. DWP3-4 TaxID=2804565 RepID=UPI003CF7A580
MNLKSSSSDETPDGVAAMLAVEMDFAMFSSDWANCDRLSDYVAAMISRDQSDPVRYANVLSSAVNELLEYSFRIGTGGGRLLCEVSRIGEIDRVALSFPVEARSRVISQLDAIVSVDVAPRYLEMLHGYHAAEPEDSLLGLKANFDASITAGKGLDDLLTIVADIPTQGLIN